MIAIDTNVLVRLLLADNPAQYKASMKLFSTEQIFIPDTVILETEWVLRAVYDFEPAQICDAFKRILGLKNVALSDGQRMAQVIAWHELGLDFADAMHLALSQHLESLKTFDAAFIKQAKPLSACRVEKP